MAENIIPYGKQSISKADIEAVREVLNSDWLTQGPAVEKFEQALCNKFGCDYAVAVNSGTMALHLAYKALGVSKGDEVVTTPNTFVATANGVLYNGGKPQFVDINPDTYNLSIEKLEQYLSQSKNRENTVGITPVHFAGQPCEMEKIYELANKYGFFVLEDACHAPGAEYKDSEGNWHKVGSCTHSDAAVLSFHPVKHITTGEGGAILTNQEELAEELRTLRTHGITKDPDKMSENHGPWYYEMQKLGFNGRITDLQCALGISQLSRLEKFVEKRRQLAQKYDHELKNMKGITSPQVKSGVSHAYHLYVIQCNQRDQLFDHLLEHNIKPQVHYIPVYKQPYYRNNFNFPCDKFEQTENYYSNCLSLPLYVDLRREELTRVLETLHNFY